MSKVGVHPFRAYPVPGWESHPYGNLALIELNKEGIDIFDFIPSPTWDELAGQLEVCFPESMGYASSQAWWVVSFENSFRS